MIRSISSNAAERSRCLVERRVAGQQFVEQHAQRIDVAPRVDVQLVQLGLLRAHVFERADHLAQPVNIVRSVSCWPDRLGHAEVDDLGHRPAVVLRDQHVRSA